MKIKIFVLFFIFINFVKCKKVPHSTYCKPFWRYVDIGNEVIEGRVDLEKEPALVTYKVEIVILFSQVYEGAADKVEFVWSSYDNSLNLKVKFPSFQNDIPHIISIHLNDREICTKPFFTFNSGTKITLTQTLHYSSVESNPTKVKPAPANFPPPSGGGGHISFNSADNSFSNYLIKRKPSTAPPTQPPTEAVNNYVTPKPNNDKSSFQEYLNTWSKKKTTKPYIEEFTNKPVTNTPEKYPTPVTPTPESAYPNYVTFKPRPVKPVKPDVIPLPIQPEDDEVESLEEICGIPKISQMLVNGKPTRRGEFPWLSIIYRREGSANLLFHCTGTLISDQHIVTAGHCIETPNNTYNAKDFISVLGKYNLQSWTELGGYIVNIRSIYLHPDYRIKTNEALYADIGVMRLERKVNFSPFIRPICLWNKGTALSEVVGRIGTTVGWSNGAADILAEPLKAEFPIVSNEDCLSSNPSFYYLVNNKTFCAGDRSGTGPCLGDSGSGFYLKEGVRWYLRGVVSLALEDRSKNCDLYSYFVFTDAASVLQWLNNFLKQ